MQPGGQVHGQRRFAHATLGIRDHDNHVGEPYTTGRHDGKQYVQQAVRMACQQGGRMP
jgi:hypothetical protein